MTKSLPIFVSKSLSVRCAKCLNINTNKTSKPRIKKKDREQTTVCIDDSLHKYNITLLNRIICIGKKNIGFIITKRFYLKKN